MKKINKMIKGDVGDEEEEDGKKSVEKSRYDFASEEDWQKYKQETVQKGGKKGDGRFGQKDVAKQKVGPESTDKIYRPYSLY